MKPNRQHLFLSSGLMMAFVCVLFLSCRQSSSDRSVQKSCDSVQLEDSAYSMVTKMAYYYGNEMVDSMELFAPEAMAFCKQHGKWRYYYKIWTDLAMDMVWRGLFQEGISEARSMHEDALARENVFGQMYAYQVMGIASGYQKDVEESADCYRHALALCEQLPDDGSKFALYNYYCEALSNKKDYEALDSILAQWKVAISAYPVDTADKNADVYANWHFKYLLMQADYLIDIRNYSEVETLLDSAAYYEEIDGNYPSSLCKLATSRYHYAMGIGNYQEAMRQAERMIQYSQDIDQSNYIQALLSHSEVLEKNGRYQEALVELRKSHELSDSLQVAENREQLNTLNRRFEVNELKFEVEREQMKAEERQMWLVIALAGMGLLGLIYVLVNRHRETVKLESEHKKLTQAYEQLEVANAKAEESLKMKTWFIRQITHEFNTPLNILTGFAEVLTMPDMSLDNREKEELSKGIRDNSERISELVNKMMDIAEDNSTTIIERRDTVKVVKIIEEAVANSGIANAVHLTFSQQVATEVTGLTIQTNMRSATRALTLILDNARKFTAPAETAQNRQDVVSEDEKKHAQLSVSVNESEVSFVVEDDGISIPPEEAEHIFEEFVQLDDYYDGTGLGLSVARNIARKLGGDIVLDTTYANGARFTLTLPRL